MMRLLVCFGGLMLCLMGLMAQTVEDRSFSLSIPTSIANQQLFHMIITGNNRMAFDLYQKLRGESRDLCFSPYSIATGLAMVAIGAKGETANQLQRVLGYPLGVVVRVGDLNETLVASAVKVKGASQLELANAIWLDQSLPLESSFQRKFERSFKGDVQLLDFAHEPIRAVRVVNEWVSKQTNGKISDVLSIQDVSEETGLVLTTAIYMRGQWVHLFDRRQTERLPFHVNPRQTLLTDMMRITASYLLRQGEGFDLIVLPYVYGDQGAQLAMTILLPKGQATVEDLERELTWENWRQWQSQGQMRQVALTLPRFRVNERLDLKLALSALGLTQMFTPDADFSGISPKRGLFVNKVVHKTFVKVDERGTEAAGVTAIGMTPTSIPDSEAPYEFKADHPFIFVIWDQASGAILFMGRLLRP